MADPTFDALVAAMDGAVVVVTAAVGDERDGCLVGFHSQAGIDPPRYAVWLSTANRTWTVARRAGHLAVHVLGDDQHDLARQFGGETGDEVEKLPTGTWEAGAGGAPLLVACANRFVGRVTGRHDVGGDHVCVVVDPVDASFAGLRRPLRLGAVGDVEPGHPA